VIMEWQIVWNRRGSLDRRGARIGLENQEEIRRKYSNGVGANIYRR